MLLDIASASIYIFATLLRGMISLNLEGKSSSDQILAIKLTQDLHPGSQLSLQLEGQLLWRKTEDKSISRLYPDAEAQM